MGRKQTPETREKLRQANLGKKLSPETREKIAATLQGRPHTPERIKARSGWTHTPDARERIGAAQRGSKSVHWKADPGYKAIHLRVSKAKTRTGLCSHCGADVGIAKGTGTDWANTDHQYRVIGDDWLDDYIELCRTCHRAHDKTLSR